MTVITPKVIQLKEAPIPIRYHGENKLQLIKRINLQPVNKDGDRTRGRGGWQRGEEGGGGGRDLTGWKAEQTGARTEW